MLVAFASKPPSQPLSTFEAVKAAAQFHWNRLWMTGGAIDLSESRDPRWKELERRIVLSQYQTAVNCAGSLPPQETGLVTNSWGGKFHLEMYWWHEAHFALWGREALLEKSLWFYQQTLPVARETAARISCKGARWPKMIGPTRPRTVIWPTDTTSSSSSNCPCTCPATEDCSSPSPSWQQAGRADPQRTHRDFQGGIRDG